MTVQDDLLTLSQQALWLHFIVFLRVGPTVSFFPGFGEQSLPVRVKLAAALILTLVVAPAVSPDLAAIVTDPAPLGWIVLTETGIGLLLGIGIRLFLLALQTAGSIAAQATSLSQILGSAGLEPLPAISWSSVASHWQ